MDQDGSGGHPERFVGIRRASGSIWSDLEQTDGSPKRVPSRARTELPEGAFWEPGRSQDGAAGGTILVPFYTLLEHCWTHLDHF